MDVDLLNSATEEDQMEMMMMMHMDNNNNYHHHSNNNNSKLAEFGSAAPFPDMAELSSIDFSTANGASAGLCTPPSLLPSPTLLSPHPSFSFMNSSFHDPVPPNPLRGELSGTSTFPCPSHKRNNSSMAAMREMIFRIAAMQPIHIDPESVKPPKRRNVKISKDPQSVAARHRRERISERIRILQRLVPGGTKMDTASMLDEAIHYVKFLKTQVQSLERAATTRPAGLGFPTMPPISSPNYTCLGRSSSYQQNNNQMMFSSTHMLS